METCKLTRSYDYLLSKVKTFYDLDSLTPIQERSSVYIIERSPRDYEFMLDLFAPEYARANVSKIKQMSSLFDLLHYVDYDYSSTKNSELRIEIYNHQPELYRKSLLQISFGNVLYFSISNQLESIPESETQSECVPESIMFASKKYLKNNELINDYIFEEIYSYSLIELAKFIEPGMTFALFNNIDNKTVDELRIENLKNTDLTYCSKAESGMFFYNFSMEPKDFFVPLKRVFSNKLMHQVKTIESLLRFESNLKYGKTVYELMFNYSLSEHKFRTPTNLYSVVFTYDYEFELSVTLYFKFKNNEIRYLEVDIDTHHTVDISGYEAIYDYIHNRIKILLTSNLGINPEELTNQSVLLYKMVSI